YGELPALEKELEARESQQRDSEPMVKEEVDEDDVATVVARWTGIPVSRLLESETEKLIHMEERLHQRVIGQEEAVSAVANALRRARTGLQDPDRPIGSFVFLGPTGVGKTELARALAEFMFDDQHAIVRLHMSEYQERHTVARLIGAPPGYVGYEEGGQLTEAVRRRPYAVILLDEIEKAHAEVFDVLLQVLDDGRLTDGQGRTVDFRNTVLIMTSNIRTAESMREHFRPEFLNRIDEIVEFRPLSREQLGEIVELQLSRLRERLAERELSLELTDAAKEALADAGWDPAYGARPLKRAIQRLLENPLALRLLEGGFAGRRHDRRRAAEGRPGLGEGRVAGRGSGLELRDVVEDLRLPGDGRRAVGEDDDLLVALVAHLQCSAPRDRDDAPSREVDTLGRVAEQHRQRSLEHDEHLFLPVVRMPPPRCVRRIAPDPCPRLRELAGGGHVCRPAELPGLVRPVLPDRVLRPDHPKPHATILNHP